MTNTMTNFKTDTDFANYLNVLTKASNPELDPPEDNPYGDLFLKLNRRQKLYLLVCVASDLCCEVVSDEEDDLTNPEITELTNKLHKELSTPDKESLMLALVSQVRCKKGE